MISKETWLHLRGLDDYPVSLFFEFYKEKGGYIEDFNDFATKFAYACLDEPILFNKQGEPKCITYTSCVINLINYYNEKFKCMI